ncbi:MAG: trypsin-like peptidase domain-containing protein [Caldilineaceae bacterium]|nr:trypsin-like peptidase domain-containing protein [Caldilineaceae bacterium]
MTEPLQTLSQSMATLVEQSDPKVVRVEARQRMPASGVIWSADGLIVTSHHVVERDEQIQVGLADGRTVAATLVGRDPGADLAVLRAEATGLTAATWVDASDLRVGHLLLALGRPGTRIQATLGIASAVGGAWRTPSGGEIDHYLQTDVVMYPGFSGGPLVAADGRFAGVTTSALMRGVSLAIPSTTIRKVVETLVAHGHMPRGYLGIGIQPVRLADGLQQSIGQETGLIVMSVESDSPAAQAGMMQGDVLVKLAGAPVRHVDELQVLLSGERVGKQIETQVVRGGQLHTFALTIGRGR